MEGMSLASNSEFHCKQNVACVSAQCHMFTAQCCTKLYSTGWHGLCLVLGPIYLFMRPKIPGSTPAYVHVNADSYLDLYFSSL